MKKLFVALLTIALFAQCTAATKIQLIGPKIFTLEAGDPFIDPGVSSLDDTKLETIISSDLNTHQPGDYEIRYTLVENGKAGTPLIRTVHVVDTTAPLITLKGTKITNVCPQTKYADEGATAFDKVDGNLSDKIVATSAADAITYTIVDAAGNKSTETRQLLYRDILAPLFTSSKEIWVMQGHAVPQPTAKDACDGNVSAHIVATKTISTQIPGNYTQTFDVSDAAGNKASFTQTVHVMMPRSSTTLYLTFDDGPSYLTGDFLDLLKEFNIKATFFVNNRTSYAALVKRAYAEGHTIAMHSATHNYYSIYASEDAFYKDLYLNQAWIKSLIGVTSNLYRFPGGSSNTVSSFNPGIMSLLTKSIRTKGIQYFDWNASVGDGSRHTAAFYYATFKSQIGTRSSYVVLMHDGAGHDQTLLALRDILTYATNWGYTFKPLSYDSPPAHHGVRN
ncbi:MAG: polysaccharide deacetylase [Erysipelotrichaceae bacterium]